MKPESINDLVQRAVNKVELQESKERPELYVITEDKDGNKGIYIEVNGTIGFVTVGEVVDKELREPAAVRLYDPDWQESEHPRDADGEFRNKGEGEGGGRPSDVNVEQRGEYNSSFPAPRKARYGKEVVLINPLGGFKDISSEFGTLEKPKIRYGSGDISYINRGGVIDIERDSVDQPLSDVQIDIIKRLYNQENQLKDTSTQLYFNVPYLTLFDRKLMAGFRYDEFAKESLDTWLNKIGGSSDIYEDSKTKTERIIGNFIRGGLFVGANKTTTE